MSVPAWELNGEAPQMKVSVLLSQILITEYSWTDSRVVLQYAKNNLEQFKVAVANGSTQKQEHSEPVHWNYTKSK